MVAHNTMTEGGCGRVWRKAEEVENALLVFAGGLKFCAHVPPLIKNCADTGCVKIIAAMIPKTIPLFLNPKYKRDFFKA